MPNEQLTQAYRDRYFSFGSKPESWEQIRQHLKRSWHGLSYLLQVNGLSKPELYSRLVHTSTNAEVSEQIDETAQSICQHTATLTWPDQHRVVVENEQAGTEMDGWDIWTLEQVKRSFE